MLHAKAFPLLAVLLLASRPDEGQWLPSQIRAMDWQKLKARGMQISKDELWHPERGGLLNAAVQLGMSDQGGCSAAFVSEQGLLITNHHCGDDAIGALSTLKNNYLNEGFVARSPEQELPTKMVLHVVRGIEDVTAKVHAAQARAQNALQRYEYTEAEIRRLVEEGEKDAETGAKDPRTTCHVASFFEGRKYELYYRTRVTDVRLVYAPPLDTANYGGNVDNWEWPRHSGDFAMFRAYVAPDGTPRAHHPDNVPYAPEHHLRVSKDGVRKGDLVMIIGYPGRTVRYLSSVAVQEWQGFRFPKRRDVLLQVIEVLRRAGHNDPEKQLRLNATIAYFANIEKKHLGEIRGLARNAVVDRKIREEEGLAAWAKRAGKDKYLNAMNAVLDLDHTQKATQEKDVVIRLLRYQRRLPELMPLLDAMTILVRSARDSEEGEGIDYPPALLEKIGSHDATQDLDRVQKPLMAVLLEEARNLTAEQTLAGTEVLADSDVPAAEMVEQLLASTDMLKGQARVALLEAGRKAIDASDDPLVVLTRGLVVEYEAFEQRMGSMQGQRMVVGQRWIEAQQAWRGTSFYPDANRTIRVSIADVQGYRPRDAVAYGPFTTIAGMLEKSTGQRPFRIPEDLRDAARHRWLSRFRNKELGDIPVCFLANGDTTNGNSGSPVINGKGELVGLNFDRVFENVSCDFGWNADRSRNISLDIRFVLWHLESVTPAPHLMREMGVR